MCVTQTEKATRFQALHNRPEVFIIPNPWDAGSARILAGLGFEALATSSAASASGLLRRDGGLTREDALAFYTQAASAEPRNARFACILGVALNANGDRPAAIAELRHSIERDPSVPDTYKNSLTFTTRCASLRSANRYWPAI